MNRTQFSKIHEEKNLNRTYFQKCTWKVNHRLRAIASKVFEYQRAVNTESCALLFLISQYEQLAQHQILLNISTITWFFRLYNILMFRGWVFKTLRNFPTENLFGLIYRKIFKIFKSFPKPKILHEKCLGNCSQNVPSTSVQISILEPSVKWYRVSKVDNTYCRNVKYLRVNTFLLL